MDTPIVDLHCDLLSYLHAKQGRTPFEPIVRCSHPQLKAGGVKLQIMAIYADTGTHCEKTGPAQSEIFQSLPRKHYDSFTFFNGQLGEKVSILAAVENASAFFGEKEPFDLGMQRLDSFLKHTPCLYISLTWNSENRFGGGAASEVGLKEEGKQLLKSLSGKGIALDFSHASDTLARASLEYIDKKSLDLRVMASHSNFRSLVNEKRNLPDDIAREIIKRKGIIGLVFYKKFLSDKYPHAIADQIAHGLALGGENALCFGADFFCLEDFPELNHGFFDEFPNSSAYPHLLQLLMGKLSEKQIQKIASENALSFING